MKNLLYIMAIGLLIMTSCTGVKTASKGLEDECFLELIGNPKDYIDGVQVTIDQKTTFNAEVIKGTAKRPKGKVYAISPGKHSIEVKYKNELIWAKQIFVSAQETKQIVLP